MLLRKSLLSLLAVSLVGCQLTQKIENSQLKPKNIILFIGDGMGPAYIKAYRMYRDDPRTANVETTLFDTMLVGSLRTDPQILANEILKESSSFKLTTAENNGNYGSVTDSAASATAYATGKKTVNGALSVGYDNRPIPTVLEKAKQLGKSTGMVVTSQLYHATPAAFVAHHLDRDDYAIIANQFIDNRFQDLPYVDVLLGGGSNYFVREDRNIASEFESLGYQILHNKRQLKNASASHLLGLFAPIGLKKMLDRKANTPSLADMTEVAIEQLSKNQKGFFLLVEGSQIDWAGHDNDIVGAMSEMQDFEQALAIAMKFARQDNQTQLLLTADHSTGGLSIGTEIQGTEYNQWKSQVVKSFIITPEEIVQRASQSQNLLKEFKSASDLPLSPSEITSLTSINPKDKILALQTITDLINQRSYTGWTTHGHTGVDVNLYAYGPVSHQLVGHWDNTKIAEFIFSLLED